MGLPFWAVLGKIGVEMAQMAPVFRKFISPGVAQATLLVVVLGIVEGFGSTLEGRGVGEAEMHC